MNFSRNQVGGQGGASGGSGIHKKFNLPIRSNEEDNSNAKNNDQRNLQSQELASLKNIDQKVRKSKKFN